MDKQDLILQKLDEINERLEMMMKVLPVTLVLLFSLVGCGENSTQVDNKSDSKVDIVAVAKETGLKEGEFTVNENGVMAIDASPKEPVDPLSVNGDNWEYVVNNAIRTADEHASKNNPQATFVGNSIKVEFIKQMGGKYEGRYLLTLVNERNNGVSYAQLLPLFDENVSSEKLDDEGKLWQVVTAKYNGKKY